MYSPKISKASAPAAKRSHSNLHAGSFEDADDGLGDFWADAVAGDQGDAMSHIQLPAANFLLFRS